MILVRGFHIKLRQAIGLHFPTSVPFFESFITRIVLPSTNHPGTFPTSMRSFKTVVRTCTAVKDFNQKPWILSGPAPFESGIDFNFLLAPSLVIFTVYCFSDGIFSFALSIHSASCLCSTFVLHIYIPKNCCIFSIREFCLLLFTSNIFEKSSLVGLEIPVVLKLFYSIVISVYFCGFCSYSLFQFFNYQCKPFSAQPILLIWPFFLFFLALFPSSCKPYFYSA